MDGTLPPSLFSFCLLVFFPHPNLATQVALNIDNRGAINQPVLVDYTVLLPTGHVKPTVLRYPVVW